MRRGRPWVLMYHAVEPYRDDPLLVCVSPARFEEQMAWLAHRGLRGVSMRDLRSAISGGRGRGLVGLTFDDGYAGFLSHALPVLARHGFSATVFAVADRLGGRNDWDEGPHRALLTASDLAEVAAQGMEVGSHGMTHARLTRLAPEQIAAEVENSRELLRDTTGAAVEGFSYPYGAHDSRAVSAVEKAGYEYACTVFAGRENGRFLIPRAFVGERDRVARLTAKRVVSRLNLRRQPAVA
ncbi:MAG: polysaccharide deacetylase family protein [Thermoleophilaceae bacterium]